jgi:8-oxo-dGTP pyrophosphatase MutT (NUDIX family)
MTKKRFARGIVRNGNRFLVVFNKKRMRYEFPGGKCDDGEDFAKSLSRELLEEIGISVIRQSLLCEHDLTIEGAWKGDDEGKSEWNGQFWLIDEYTGTPHIPQSEAHKLADLRWVTVDELVRLPQIPLVTVEVARRVMDRSPESFP